MGRNHFQAPGKLPELVKSKFINAKANGDIHFYPTQVTVLTPASVPVRPIPLSIFLLDLIPQIGMLRLDK